LTTLFSEPLPRTSGTGTSPLPGRSRLPEGSAVLVVLFGRIGDVVFTLPSVAALAKARPDVSIDWIVEDRCADLLKEHPHIREIILFKRSEISGLWRKGHPIRALRELSSEVGALRRSPYAAVLDFQGLLKSGIATGLARGATKLGSPSTYGRMKEGAGLFSRQVPLTDIGLHLVERHLLVAEELLGVPLAPESTGLVFGEEEIRSAREKVGTGPFLLIHPFASWPTRSWSVDSWKEVAEEIAGRGFRILVAGAGGASQEEFARKILEGLPERGQKAHRALLGTLTLRELAVAMALSEAVVAVDSGPMHIAAAVGARVVALFGPTDPVRLGPFGPRRRPGEGESYGRSGTVLTADLPCQPCMLRRCPIGTPCQSRLTPSMVTEAFGRILKDQERAGLSRLLDSRSPERGGGA